MTEWEDEEIKQTEPDEQADPAEQPPDQNHPPKPLEMPMTDDKRHCIGLLQIGVQVDQGFRVSGFAPQRMDIIERMMAMLRKRQKDLIHKLLGDARTNAEPAVEWHVSNLLRKQSQIESDRFHFMNAYRKAHGDDPELYDSPTRTFYNRALRDFKWKKEAAVDKEANALLFKLKPDAYFKLTGLTELPPDEEEEENARKKQKKKKHLIE